MTNCMKHWISIFPMSKEKKFPKSEIFIEKILLCYKKSASLRYTNMHYISPTFCEKIVGCIGNLTDISHFGC